MSDRTLAALFAAMLCLLPLAPGDAQAVTLDTTTIGPFPTILHASGLTEPITAVAITNGFAFILAQDATTAEILIIPGSPPGSVESLSIFSGTLPVEVHAITIAGTTPAYSVNITMIDVGTTTIIGNGETVTATTSPVSIKVTIAPPNPGLEVVLRNLANGATFPLAIDGSGVGMASVPLEPGLQTLVVTAEDPGNPFDDPFIRWFYVDLGAAAGFTLTNAGSVHGTFEPWHNPARNRRIEGWAVPPAAGGGCPPYFEFGQSRQGGGTDGGGPILNPYLPDDDDDGVNVDINNCDAFWHLGLLTLPGRGIPLSVRANYSSNLDLGPTGYVMGKVWVHSYVQRLLPGATTSVVRRFDGAEARIDTYADRGDGFLVAPGIASMMRVNTDGTRDIRLRGGLVYHYKAFDDPVAPGALWKVSDPHDNAIRLFYEVTPNGFGRLHRIVDTYGADALMFTYRPDGLLDRITDLTSREVIFGYDADQRLTMVRSPTGPEFPSGRVYRFRYEASTTLLAGVTYPNENAAGLASTERVTFIYDASGCVVGQKLGGTNASGLAAGGTIHYAQGTRSSGGTYSRVTDRNGNITEYDFDAAGRTTKITHFTSGVRTNGPFVTTHTYNLAGLCTSTTYPEGNATTCTYPSSPNPFQIQDVLSTTRIAGPRGGNQSEITVKRAYEALFNKVARIEDPRFVDPSFTPPLGSKAHLVTTIVYEYQELTGVPSREAGWGITAAELELGKPDLNGNGTSFTGCATVQSITHPTTTLLDGTTQLRRTLATYNKFGQRTSTTDPGGVKTTFVYEPEIDPDGSGSHTVPGGDTVTGGFLRSTTRDATPGSIYAFHEPITSEVRFNRIGDIQAVTDGRGITTSFVTNEIHLATRITLASDTSAQAGARNEAEAVPALSIVTKLTRDANDNVVRTEVDNRGNELTHAGAFIATTTLLDILDRPRRVTREVTESDTVEATLGYDANENLTSLDSTQVPHTHIKRSYDSRDLLFELTRGLGAEAATSTFEIDKNGNVIRVVGPVDRPAEAGAGPDGTRDTIAAYDLDGFDRVVTTSDGLGNFTTVTYDPASNVLTTAIHGHPANAATAAKILLRATEFVYDEASRLARSRLALFVDSDTAASLVRPSSLDTDNPSSATHVELERFFDVNSLVTKARVANRTLGGFEESITAFDGHYRPRTRTDAVGNIVRLLYNNNHQVVSITETDVQPEGETADEIFVSSVVRDAVGRVIRSTDPKGDSRTFTWGTLVMTEALDMLDNKSTFQRDGLGRLLRTRRFLSTTGGGGAGLDTSNPANPDGLITTRAVFSDTANTTSLIDDRGNTTGYVYDTRRNVKRVTYADGTDVETVFDLGDAPTTVTDNAGNVFANTFDILGRLVQTDITRASGFIGTTLIRRGYDGLSRLTSSFDNGGEGDLAFTSTLACRYDSLDNKLEEVHNGRVVSREWKSAGDPVRLTYPDGFALAYETDRLDRLTRLLEGSSETARWRYIGGRTHRREWGNGTSTEYTWDLDRRLTGVVHKRGGAAFLDYTLGYNQEDYFLFQRRNHDGGKGELIQLDSAYRVLSYKDGVQNPEVGSGAGTVLEETFTLDGVGNWNAQSTSTGGGTPTTITTAVNEMNEYTSFAGATQTHNDNGDRTLDDRHTYEWDALGRLRIVRDKATGKKLSAFAYHADGRRTRKAEFNPGGQLKDATEFAWDGMRMVFETKKNGQPRAKTVWGRGWELVKYQTSVPLYYHRDGKGWIAAVTKGNGKVREGYRYSAYGKATLLNAAGAAMPAAAVASTPWLWHGYYQGTPEGHYYAIHRYYDASSGRWISRDPLGYVDGLANQLAFAANPMTFVDHDGLTTEGIHHIFPQAKEFKQHFELLDAKFMGAKSGREKKWINLFAVFADHDEHNIFHMGRDEFKTKHPARYKKLAKHWGSAGAWNSEWRAFFSSDAWTSATTIKEQRQAILTKGVELMDVYDIDITKVGKYRRKSRFVAGQTADRLLELLEEAEVDAPKKYRMRIALTKAPGRSKTAKALALALAGFTVASAVAEARDQYQFVQAMTEDETIQAYIKGAVAGKSQDSRRRAIINASTPNLGRLQQKWMELSPVGRTGSYMAWGTFFEFFTSTLRDACK